MSRKVFLPLFVVLCLACAMLAYCVLSHDASSQLDKQLERQRRLEGLR